MKKIRKIHMVIKSKPTIEGAGVHLERAFAEATTFDPFLLLDDFRSTDPRYYIKGFPWHPHRGIETITYVLQARKCRTWGQYGKQRHDRLRRYPMDDRRQWYHPSGNAER